MSINLTVRDGAVLNGQFQLQHLLSEGGMGTVWAANDLRLGRQVAVKLLSRDLFHSKQAHLRFEREAQMVARIRSPHVVQLFAQGETDDGIPFLVMELLAGEDLATCLERRGKFSLSEAAPIVEQICRGLSRAHEEGLVHRDIKPHNIFLATESADTLTIKLLDFGIAKDLNAPLQSLTLSGEVFGSTMYISPEQLRDPQSVGPAADVWALGIVIYELLTDQVPFDAKNLSQLFEQLAHGTFKPASSLVPELPEELDALLLRAIQLDPTLRFGSVNELAREYARIVRDHGSESGVRLTVRDAEQAAPAPSPSRWGLHRIFTAILVLALLGGAGTSFELLAEHDRPLRSPPVGSSITSGPAHSMASRPETVAAAAPQAEPLVHAAAPAPATPSESAPALVPVPVPVTEPVPTESVQPSANPLATESKQPTATTPRPRQRVQARSVGRPNASPQRDVATKPEARNHGF